jgi:hypothetical protein
MRCCAQLPDRSHTRCPNDATWQRAPRDQTRLTELERTCDSLVWCSTHRLDDDVPLIDPPIPIP